jgi:hypothetical protein
MLSCMNNKSYSIIITSKSLSLPINEYLGCIVLFILFICRKLPFILYNGQINPDESQMLTQAITLDFDPVFWRSVDGTTSGPINSYLILALKYVGFPFNYSTLHLASVGLISFSLFMTYLTLRLAFSTKVSFLSLLIIYSFFFLTNHKDFNHYNSELPSVALITVAFYLIARIYYLTHTSLLIFGMLGLICCSIPLAKLQGGPLASLYIVYAGLILINSSMPITRKFLLLGSLIFGIVSVIVFLVLFLYYNSILYDLYIKTNLSHYSPSNGLNLFIKLVFKSSYDYIFLLIFSFSIWVLAAFIAIREKYFVFIFNRIFLFLLINFTLSLLVIARTGYIFEHYLFYSFFPITLLTAYTLNQILDFGIIKYYSQISFNIIAIGLFAGLAITYTLKFSRKNQNFTMVPLPLYEIKVVNLINRYTEPTDCMVVWGWNLTYHVLTGLRQGTRENHSIRCMTTNSLGAIHDPQLIAYFGHQYVNDMRRNCPAIFIDEVQSNSFFENPKLVVHQKIPELKKFIANNYRLVSTQSGILVYVHKDRFLYYSRIKPVDNRNIDGE